MTHKATFLCTSYRSLSDAISDIDFGLLWLKTLLYRDFHIVIKADRLCLWNYIHYSTFDRDFSVALWGQISGVLLFL